MSIHFRQFEHLLPRARAWQLKLNLRFRQFFEGLADGLSEPARDFIDSAIWGNVDPQQTTQLELWEDQWNIPSTGLTEQERRDRIEAKWSALGGQSPQYIQDTLQGQGFDVFIYPWWELPAADPPVPLNPFTFLAGGLIIYFCECGEALAECGEALAECGETAGGPTGKLLVNKFLDPTSPFPHFEFVYSIDPDPLTFPFYSYLGADVFPNHAIIPFSRKDEFELLCCSIMPGQLWIGLLVDYV